MRDEYLQVDELLLQLADYKNDVADMAAEQLLRKCLTNWEAYRHLKDRFMMPGYPKTPDSR